MGIIGPAVATLVAILVIQIYQLFLSAKTIKTTFADIFPWKKCSTIIFINMIFAIIFYCIKCVSPLELYMSEIGESILLGLVWTIIYFAATKKKIQLKWHELNADYKV